MGIIILSLLAVNFISFLMFVFRKRLDNTILLKAYYFDDFAKIVAIGGAFGAFIAMKIEKKGFSGDSIFKIAIPISMVIQAIAITYLLLYDVGIVK